MSSRLRGMTATTFLPPPGTVNTTGGALHSAAISASPRPDSESMSRSRGRRSVSADGSHTPTETVSAYNFRTTRQTAVESSGTACRTTLPTSSETTRQQSSTSSGSPHRAKTSAVCRRAHPAAVGVAANCCAHPAIGCPEPTGRSPGSRDGPRPCAGTGGFGVGPGGGQVGGLGVQATGIGGGSEGEHGTTGPFCSCQREDRDIWLPRFEPENRSRKDRRTPVKPGWKPRARHGGSAWACH